MTEDKEEKIKEPDPADDNILETSEDDSKDSTEKSSY